MLNIRPRDQTSGHVINQYLGTCKSKILQVQDFLVQKCVISKTLKVVNSMHLGIQKQYYDKRDCDLRLS